MKERPILFSGPMVRAILESSKTQTRRIVKGRAGFMPVYITPINGHPPKYGLHFHNDRIINSEVECTYGNPGDRIWVRETHRFQTDEHIEYRADGATHRVQDNAEWLREKDIGQKWRPSLFMPRWASRITLEIVSVRAERLQEISEEDAKAEGAEGAEGFQKIWCDINGASSWAANPWVWVIEFKRIK